MGIALKKQDNDLVYNVKEFICDTIEDLAYLDTYCAPGSSAICLETGEVYVFGSDKEWHLLGENYTEEDLSLLLDFASTDSIDAIFGDNPDSSLIKDRDIIDAYVLAYFKEKIDKKISEVTPKFMWGRLGQ